MVRSETVSRFQTTVPADIEHAAIVRQEALDWLETQFPGIQSFSAGDVLRMAGEQERRWLMTRMRAQGIAGANALVPPEAADALTVLFLRSRGVKFAEAIEAVANAQAAAPSIGQSFGGIWNRLMLVSLERMQRLVPPRIIGAGITSLLGSVSPPPNTLIVIRRLATPPTSPSAVVSSATSDEVYYSVLERPVPEMAITSPWGELIPFGEGQSPTISEFRSRSFIRFQIAGTNGGYEVFIGATTPLAAPEVDEAATELAGQALDLVFVHMDAFESHVRQLRFDVANEPQIDSQENLDLWLMAKLVSFVYSEALVDVTQVDGQALEVRVLASSAGLPWDQVPWDPPKTTEMLSGYASQVGVPLVMSRITEPLFAVVENIASEIQFLNRDATAPLPGGAFAAAALPIYVGSGAPFGSMYVLAPRSSIHNVDTDMRLLAVLARVIGETVQRRQAASLCTSEVANISSARVLGEGEFHRALTGLLNDLANPLQSAGEATPDLRLPILVVSAETPEPESAGPQSTASLERWLGNTLGNLAWRPFLRAHLTRDPELASADCIAGRVSDKGVVIAFDRLVPKEQLDRIRSAFPSKLNAITPTNSPVKLVAWVLDVPARNLVSAVRGGGTAEIADEIQRWAIEASSVVDDLTQSFQLALEQGDWDTALKRLRRGIRKPQGKSNPYLHRRAADCCFALGDWPSALRYARAAANVGEREIGSGQVRSLCLVAEAHLCLGHPMEAWQSYARAVEASAGNPQPHYYRGQGLLLMARLANAFAQERTAAGGLTDVESSRLEEVTNTLSECAIADLTQAGDVFEQGSETTEESGAQNRSLVPSLIGQGAGYLLSGMPGPAASRFQSARRSVTRDEMIFREFLFAKCWEQGVHRTYGEAFLGSTWDELRPMLESAFDVG